MQFPVGRSGWARFQQRPRWQRRGAYVGAPLVAVLVLGGIGNAVAGGGGTSAPPDGETTGGLPAVTQVVGGEPATTVSPPAASSTNAEEPTPVVAPPPTIVAPRPTAVPSTTLVATTTVAPSRAVTVAGAVGALDLLAFIPVANEHRGAGYDRASFEYPSDPDGDGCDTRADVLLRDSRSTPRVTAGCHVAGGTWVSPYDGRTYTQPSALEIDHVVALKEAWDSGAWAWDGARRAAFANDIAERRSLRPVDGASNRTKGDKDPSNWIPENPADVCSYLSDWVSIKARWGLSMDQSEAGRIRNLLTRQCPNEMVVAVRQGASRCDSGADGTECPARAPAGAGARARWWRGLLRQLRRGPCRRRDAAPSWRARVPGGARRRRRRRRLRIAGERAAPSTPSVTNDSARALGNGIRSFAAAR